MYFQVKIGHPVCYDFKSAFLRIQLFFLQLLGIFIIHFLHYWYWINFSFSIVIIIINFTQILHERSITDSSNTLSLGHTDYPYLFRYFFENP